MKKTIFWCIFFISFKLVSQQVEPIKFSKLQEKILSSDSELTVFNFWATWCAPCIKELPHFETLDSKDNVKVYLVSLDFPDQLEKVKKFVSKKKLNSEVLFLDEKDPDTYIPKVNKEWSGAIPATLFVTDLGKTFFHEKAFNKEELEKTVNKYLY
ncbi:MAG: TlpA disulfide reductase family protein [Bacteroidota bacterium]